MRKRLLFAVVVTFAMALALTGAPVQADALHGFCAGAGQCVDNGTNSPSTGTPTSFGFWVSGGPKTGSDFLIEVLVPNNETGVPSALSFGITGDLSGTASLFSTTSWTSGSLDSFLGISAKPNNPIDAFLPSTQTLDPGATGFFVYQADLGPATLGGAPGSPTEFTNITPDLLLASYLVGFFNEGTFQSPNWTATANSGAIFDTGSTPVPEPSSLSMLGFGTLGLLGLARKRFAA